MKGASTDVVRAVMDKAGLRYTIEMLPWTRAFDAARHERNTFIYSVARTQDREGQLLWVGKICERRLALYCLKERTDLLGHTLAELPASTFAVIQGDASADLLRKLGVGDRNLHVLRDAGSDLAANHVLEGRSDFFVSNPERLQYTAKGTPLRIRKASRPPVPQPTSNSGRSARSATSARSASRTTSRRARNQKCLSSTSFRIAKWCGSYAGAPRPPAVRWRMPPANG